MSRGTLKHMYAVARKKPKLQKVIDELMSYERADIEDMKEFQVWIRKHLLSIYDAEKAKERMGDMNIPGAAGNILLDNPVYRYWGPDRTVKGSGLDFEIENGDVFMVVNSCVVKINSTVLTCNADVIGMLVSVSEYIDTKTIPEYNMLLQNVLEEKYGDQLEDERNSEYGYLSAIRIDK